MLGIETGEVKVERQISDRRASETSDRTRDLQSLATSTKENTRRSWGRIRRLSGYLYVLVSNMDMLPLI